MRAKENTLLALLCISKQFVIPVYQRPYSWKTEQCSQLWNDILRAGRNEKTHFMGPVIYAEEKKRSVTPEMMVIDGQQRLATVMLVLEALAQKLKGDKIGSFSTKKIRDVYLHNQDENGQHHYRLILGKTDKESLNAIVDHKERAQIPYSALYENFNFFINEMAILDINDLVALCKGLEKTNRGGNNLGAGN